MPIYQKINQVMRRVVGVEKDGTNKHGNYDFASHNAVTRALRGHYAELGIVREAAITSLDVIDGGHINVKGYVQFTDAEDLSSINVPFATVQHCQTSKGQVTAQQAGQALSYAVKNVELKLFALTDTEGDSDSSHPTPEPESVGDQARADDLLRRIGLVKNQGELDAVMATIKAEWKELKGVFGFADSVSAMKKNAEQRIGGENG
jgi:hypothetical protein